MITLVASIHLRVVAHLGAARSSRQAPVEFKVIRGPQSCHEAVRTVQWMNREYSETHVSCSKNWEGVWGAS
eukprot:2301729-Amphidinium_carterae.1